MIAQLVKNPPAMQVDPGSIPGLGRSLGEGKGYLLQYFGLENSMDFIVHGVAKSWRRLSDFRFHLMRWMNLELIIQNEVSQKKKNIIY